MTTVLAPLQNGGLEQPGLDPRVLQCGFARLLGKDVDYIVRKYEIVLGRRSKASTLDVILGDFMSVSRQHARILYSFPSARWELQVLGKNGVAVDGVTYLPGGDPVPLASRALLQIGQDVSFHFLLPSSTRRRHVSVIRVSGPDPIEPSPAAREAAEWGHASVAAQQAQQAAPQQPGPQALLAALSGHPGRAAVQSLQGQALEQEQAGLTPAQHQQLLQAWQAQQYGNPHQYGR
ncbi:Fork head transcription factor 1 [Auxenochlorella protothecoides]|uniref:Fork head transcription factor 1 n=1 Tax=Auxenochlorella protothecoides TaxID=3075 RepID=A0A087SKH3_AUXPR|nr:Fork head transcription factor 1 [Auxenochlorella protothecoides]KFM26227.1 Fork head transcription factor 1 [Auxenochlorella protothecoides]